MNGKRVILSSANSVCGVIYTIAAFLKRVHHYGVIKN